MLKKIKKLFRSREYERGYNFILKTDDIDAAREDLAFILSFVKLGKFEQGMIDAILFLESKKN